MLLADICATYVGQVRSRSVTYVGHSVTPNSCHQSAARDLARDPMSDVEVDGEVEETEVVESEGGPCAAVFG